MYPPLISALDFFQRTMIQSHSPRSHDWFNQDWMPDQQEGTQWVATLGVAYESRATKVRWGYVYNDDLDFDTIPGDLVFGLGSRSSSFGSNYEHSVTRCCVVIGCCDPCWLLIGET